MYVYKFINDNDEVIYIGKTEKLLRRIKEHNLDNNWFNEVAIIEYRKFSNEKDMDIAERYYIMKYKPKYNQTLFEFDTKLKLKFDCNWLVLYVKNNDIYNTLIDKDVFFIKELLSPLKVFNANALLRSLIYIEQKKTFPSKLNFCNSFNESINTKGIKDFKKMININELNTVIHNRCKILRLHNFKFLLTTKQSIFQILNYNQISIIFTFNYINLYINNFTKVEHICSRYEISKTLYDGDMNETKFNYKLKK